MPHSTAQHAAAAQHATAAQHAAARSGGRAHGRRSTLTTGMEGRPEVHGSVSRDLDCEDGCHYCQGPETD